MLPKLLYNEIGPTGKPYQKGDWKLFAVHTDKAIKGFFGDYRFLSNFHPVTVSLDGVAYPSVEHAYQAAKWKPDAAARKIFTTVTALETIDYNRKNVPDGYTPKDWDIQKVIVMRDLVRQKFDANKELENWSRLQSTGTKHIEEMNWWGDIFWGTDKDGRGENMLGKILMEIRDLSESVVQSSK